MKTLNKTIGDLVKGLKIGSKDVFKDGGAKHLVQVLVVETLPPLFYGII